jgi:SAM-dependent methyltransferase
VSAERIAARNASLPNLQPDDPCGCNSGKRYADCHMPIFEAPDGEMLQVARTVYVREWSENAEGYSAQGIYRLLAEELVGRGEVKRILDIGCGLGHGLSALRDQLPGDALQLIGIDENSQCLTAAAARLGIAAVPANIDRMQDEVLPSGRYRSTYRRGAIVGQEQIALVQSDLLVRDIEFERYMDAIGPLDAITLWFSGIHKARSSTEVARVFEVKSDSDHRELVEDASLELAERRLRPGGSLQIVIRGGFPSPQLARSTVAESFGPVLEDRPLRLRSITPTHYKEPAASAAIRVRSTHAAVNALPNYAVSILVEKQ